MSREDGGYPLYIPRGGVFYGIAWPLTDRLGNALHSTDNLDPVCKVRPWRSAVEVTELATSIILLALPNYDEPVAAAQIDQMTPEQTAAFPYASGVWDLLVNAEKIEGGPVVATLLVSRP